MSAELHPSIVALEEAEEMLDARFDETCRNEGAKAKLSAIAVAEGACCTPTPGGKS